MLGIKKGNSIARGRPSQLMISKKSDYKPISLSPVPQTGHHDEMLSPAITKKGTLDDSSAVPLLKKVTSLPLSEI